MLAALLSLFGFFASALGASSKNANASSARTENQTSEAVVTSQQVAEAVDDVAPSEPQEQAGPPEPEAAPEPVVPVQQQVVTNVGTKNSNNQNSNTSDEAENSPQTTTNTPNNNVNNTNEPVAQPVVQDAPVTPPNVPTTNVEGSTDGPESVARASFADNDGTIEGGRVTTFELDTDGEIASIRVTGMPDNGNVVVNPDNSIAVIMTGSDFSGDISFDLEVSFTDGTTESMTAALSVSDPAQDQGWGLGKQYMLEEDENGEIIVETGDNHRPIYVSESDAALTKADIAALEGLKESDITTNWLVDHPEYGGSEELALATDIGMDVWEQTTMWETTSNWLLFEKGYTYTAEDLGRLTARGADGESELHPMHITSWGDGARPVLDTYIRVFQTDSENIVFSDVTLAGGMQVLGNGAMSNFLFDDVLVTDNALSFMGVDNITIHDSELLYVASDEAKGDDWHAHVDRSTALFTADVDGLMIVDSIWHQNGWTEGYDDEDIGGQPPSMFSHNAYLGHTNYDLTFTGNIVSQGSSFGLMARGGGYIEDNFFVDSNAHVSFLGGDYEGAGPIGNFTFFADNVLTEGSHKEAPYTGALTLGILNEGEMSTLLDNIVAHVGDPNDAEAFAEKWFTNEPVVHEKDPFYDDTITFNWDGGYKALFNLESSDSNVEGLDPDVLNQTTIYLFAEMVLGEDDVSISQFVEYIASLAETEYDDTFDVQSIISYFQNGFGVAPNGDESQTEHTFVANDLADGVRWDNRINWDSEDVPDDGDSVSLNGNWVQYGATTKIEDLDLGSNGALSVNHGKLTVEGDLTAGDMGGTITTDGAGQFFTDGFGDEDRITFDIDGGRFANLGEFDGTTSIDASGGQTLLGVDDAEMVLGDSSELRITGSDAKVGFDGDNGGISVLQMSDDATLSFVADAEGFSTIQEFRSGMFDQDGSDVKSGVSLDGTLQIDLSELKTTGNHTLIEVDALDGILDDIHVHGLADTMNAQFIVDYNADTLSLNLTSGSGDVAYSTVGSAGNGSGEAADLWAALTAGQGTFDEGAPTLSEDDADMADLLAS